MARKFGTTKQVCVVNGEQHKILGGYCIVAGKMYNILKGVTRYNSEPTNRNILFANSNATDAKAVFEDAELLASAGRNASTAGKVTVTLPITIFKTPVYAFVFDSYRISIFNLTNRNSSSVTKTLVTRIPQSSTSSLYPDLNLTVSGTNLVLTWKDSDGTTTSRGGSIFVIRFPSYTSTQIDTFLSTIFDSQLTVSDGINSVEGESRAISVAQTAFIDTVSIVRIGNLINISYYAAADQDTIFVSNNPSYPSLLKLSVDPDRYYLSTNGTLNQAQYGASLHIF